ncbi:MAG: SUMF1/EgtB/PvdO family nonheme iron enzyme [Anaerolineae bacterium]|nr:SUMF1/EgtB/PvdO family nonheme iron enzyme [Anaerolineae bacterium]
MTEYKPKYDNSYALVIGIDHYEDKRLPDLSTAVYGAREVGITLKALGFRVDELFEAEATKDTVLDWLETMTEVTGPDDRIFFYFAGHGATRTAARAGAQSGFLKLAGSKGYRDALAMDEVLSAAHYIQAKHVFYALDCCFSGLAIPPRGRTPRDIRKLYKEMMTAPALEILTAGSGDEEIVDRLTFADHSPFTYYFLRGLREREAEKDGIIDGDELAGYVIDCVLAEPKLTQRPQYHYQPGPDGRGGWFVFVAPRERTPGERRAEVQALIDALPDEEARAELTHIATYDDELAIREMALRALLAHPAPPPEPVTRSEKPAPAPARKRLPFEPEWCTIPAGPFLMGSTEEHVKQVIKEANWDGYKNELPQRTVDIPYDYRIGKYPVTWAQFEPFVNAGGYTNRAYWTQSGWAWREKVGIVKPALWNVPKWRVADHPANGISWYEAYAYCKWLSEQLGYEVRLPTESEWEKAARGTDGRIYPWGDTFDKNKCNVYESKIGTTTPVGKYSPAGGDSPYGCADMAGNVWEWCLTKWRKDYSIGEDNITKGDLARVLRGGSFRYYEWNARAADRLRDFPRNFSGGLRAASPISF